MQTQVHCSFREGDTELWTGTPRQTECTLLEVRQVGVEIRVTVQRKGEKEPGAPRPGSPTEHSVSLFIQLRQYFLLHRMFVKMKSEKIEKFMAQYLALFSVQEIPLSGTKLTSRSYNPLISTIYNLI